jgi:NAD(P)-dependent dehydrogenase (short-subunit alcohol dehydrogenase family)
VVVADVDDKRAEETATGPGDSSATAMAVHCDVARESEVETAVAGAATKLGGIDILLNNAGLL